MEKIKALRADMDFEVEVRKMRKDETPDNGIVYYCDDESGAIYEESELRFTPPIK